MKKCGTCKEVLPLSCFSKHKGYKDGLRYQCRKCSNKESTRWQRTNPDKWFNAYLKRMYGISLDDYNKMNSAQGGLCALCKQMCNKYPRLSVDHCHDTGEVRALLCDGCNVGLGNFKDNASLLRDAASYLEQHYPKTGRLLERPED